jgi:SAM-dependent methyltransferase
MQARPMSSERRALECDYDLQPGRVRLAREIARRYGGQGDIHPKVAARFVAEGALPVLDVGCGEGELQRHLPDGGWAGIDSSPTMLAGAPPGARLGRAEELPFAPDSFGGAALLYVLYHLDEPAPALAEARRVVRPGGLVAVAGPSRYDSPELAFALPKEPLTFDAELAPGLMAEHFDAIEVEPWDLPLLTLPEANAVRDYLVGKGVERARAATAAQQVDLPLTVTKRGALVWGRAP